MKNSNFIDALSPAQQKEGRYWFLTTLFLFIIVGISMAVIQVPQLYVWWQVKKEYTSLKSKTQLFETVLAQKRDLKLQEETVQSQVNALEKYAQHPKNPIGYLTHLNTICKNGSMLQSLKIHKKTIEIVGIFNNQKEALALSEQLVQLPLIKNMQLVSLKQSGLQGVMAVFKGTVSYWP